MKRQHKPSKAKHVPNDAAMQRASSLEKQQSMMPNDVDADAPLLVLHVIRILALYLYVLLSRSHSESHHDTLDLDDVFFPQAKTLEMLMESTILKLEEQLHSAIITCVQGEIASNQFDGLIQEKTVFAAIKRVFRMQKIKARLQCQLLAQLLNRYLAQLSSTPIVHCDAVSTLASTLEYLSNESKNANVSHSLLYPLVNAVDSLSIEQRECLDSLTTLWRWLSACDPTERLLQRIVAMHHSVIFCIESVLPSTADTPGACFVRTLVHHADHVFRHDLGFTDPQDLLSSDSETEVDDEATATSSTTEPPSTPPSTARPQPPTFSPSTRARAPGKKSNQKTNACSRKHKTASPPKILSPKATTRVDTTEIDDALLVLDANEPVPASMMRVGIAAAAGTLAAALCVIFT